MFSTMLSEFRTADIGDCGSAMGSQLSDEDDDRRTTMTRAQAQTPDTAWFSTLCEKYMHPEPMPALANRTIQAAMVHNVVGSVWYGCMVESGRIERHLPSAYVRNFTSVVIRWANPYVTMLLFSNGFAVVVGAMSPEEFLCAVHLGRMELQAMGYQPTLRYFSVDNTVASGHVPFHIELENYDSDGCCLEYEPNLFPGGILTVYEPHSVVLLFTSGSFMLTGLRTKADCDIVYCHILRIAERFRAKGNSTNKKKKTAAATAAAAPAPVKRKAQARESKQLLGRMQRESAAQRAVDNDADDEDDDDDDDGKSNNMATDTPSPQSQPPPSQQQQQQLSAADMTKAQKKEFLRRAHICSRNVRGHEKIQAIHRAVLTQYLIELQEEIIRKAEAKAQKAAAAQAKRNKKQANARQKRHAAAAAAAATIDVSANAMATLSSFVDPQTLEVMRATAMSSKVMKAIDEFGDEYDAI